MTSCDQTNTEGKTTIVCLRSRAVQMRGLLGGRGCRARLVDAILGEHAELHDSGSKAEKVGSVDVRIKGNQPAVRRPHQSIDKGGLRTRERERKAI